MQKTNASALIYLRNIIQMIGTPVFCIDLVILMLQIQIIAFCSLDKCCDSKNSQHWSQKYPLEYQ